MLRIKYELAASNYFLDNGELTFDLHVTIEGLVFTNGLPMEGSYTLLADGFILWAILGHFVHYRLDGNSLTIAAVAPMPS